MPRRSSRGCRTAGCSTSPPVATSWSATSTTCGRCSGTSCATRPTRQCDPGPGRRSGGGQDPGVELVEVLADLHQDPAGGAVAELPAQGAQLQRQLGRADGVVHPDQLDGVV